MTDAQVAESRIHAELPRLEALGPLDRIQWAREHFPRQETVVTSSFGAESAALLHMISQVSREIPVVFLNTGFLFPETIRYAQTLSRLLGLSIREIRPRQERGEFLAQHGPIYRTDPDYCCGCNKVEPMQRALTGVTCWISGLRRDQSESRKDTRVLELQSNGLHKLNPIYDLTGEEIERYYQEHALPAHPLLPEGFTSIGCVPCTSRPRPGAGPRSGRWAEFNKEECGIHTLPSDET